MLLRGGRREAGREAGLSLEVAFALAIEVEVAAVLVDVAAVVDDVVVVVEDAWEVAVGGGVANDMVSVGVEMPAGVARGASDMIDILLGVAVAVTGEDVSMPSNHASLGG